jgi:ribonuclease HII
MGLALRGLKAVDKKSILLVDGRDNYIFDVTGLPEPEYIIRGDDIVPQIMAASIVAKVTRDRIMVEHEDIFP